MSPGTALFGILTTNASTLAMIVNRCYPVQAVQFAAFPLVTYEINDSQYDRHYGGASGLSSHQVTLSCIGSTYDSAEALGAAVVTLLDNGAGTWGGITVQGCFVNDVGDALETIIETEKRIWRKDIQLTLWLAA